MTPTGNPGSSTPTGFIRRHIAEIGFVAASLVWAAVIIDTGDIAWPLAAWMGTALVPMTLDRRKPQDDAKASLS